MWALERAVWAPEVWHGACVGQKSPQGGWQLLWVLHIEARGSKGQTLPT